MAKILFVNMPAHGHANPTFPLVSAFVKAGHTVDYLLAEDFRKKVEYSGANLIPYPSFELDFKYKLKTIKNIRAILRIVTQKMKALAPGYDAVIVGGMYPSITTIQKEVSRTRVTPIIFGSASFLQNEATVKHLFKKAWGIPDVINFTVLHPNLRKWLSRHVISHVFGTPMEDVLTMFRPQSSYLNIVFTSRYFQPEESTFDNQCLFIGPTPTIALKDDTFPLEQLKEAGRPIIYATLGTIFNTWTGFFRIIIQAFKDSGYLVVMSTGNKERLKEIGEIPENFIVRDFVPQAEVLNQADLFIAHGGMGSVSDGMYLGVPMILVPLGADQFFNAYRLQELGAAKVLKKRELSPENLRREAELMLENDSFKNGVKRVQESFMNAGGPDRAVREVEKILDYLSERTGNL